jgi:hypothetical protein
MAAIWLRVPTTIDIDELFIALLVADVKAFFGGDSSS